MKLTKLFDCAEEQKRNIEKYEKRMEALAKKQEKAYGADYKGPKTKSKSKSDNGDNAETETATGGGRGGKPSKDGWLAGGDDDFCNHSDRGDDNYNEEDDQGDDDDQDQGPGVKMNQMRVCFIIRGGEVIVTMRMKTSLTGT